MSPFRFAKPNISRIAFLVAICLLLSLGTPRTSAQTPEEIAAYQAAETSRSRLIRYMIRLDITHYRVQTSIGSHDAARTRRIRWNLPFLLEAASQARKLSEQEVKSVPEFQDVTKLLIGFASSVGLNKVVSLNNAEGRAAIQTMVKPLSDEVAIRWSEEFLKAYCPVDETSIPKPTLRRE